MSPLVGVGFVLLVLVLYALWVSRPSQQRSDVAAALARFDGAADTGPLSAGLNRLARPAVRTQLVADMSRNPMLRTFHTRLVASGMYSRSLEVYLAYQVAAVVVAGVLLVSALLLGSDTLTRLVLGIGGLGLAYWPYDRVNRAARDASEEASQALPEFVELLLIPLSSGMSIEASLAFTARQTTGVVADGVQWLLETLASRTMPETEAYAAAGRRIGGTEAASFFSALYQSQIQGVQIIEPLRKQANSLRVRRYQEQRAKIKRIPVKLIVAFAMHLLPLLFIIVMVPLLYSLAQL